MPPSTTSTITLHINGEKHTLPVDRRTTLLTPCANNSV